MLPVCKAVPPDEAAYQSIVSPAPALADIVTDPVPHRLAPVPVGTAGMAFTVATTAVRVDDKQP